MAIRGEWALTAAISVWAAVLTLTVYPGEMTPDVFDQFAQGKAWTFNNAHPVLLSAFHGLSNALIGGPGLVFVAQMALGAAALVAAVWTLVPKTTFAQIAFGILALNPLLWAQWLAIWKDTWLTICLLLGFAALKKGWSAAAIAAFAFMCCFRHNGITAILPLAVWLAVSKTDVPWKGAGWAAAMLLAAFLAPKALDRALTVAEAHPASPTFVFDVAGVYVRDPQAFREGPYAKTLKLSVIRERYQPLTARYLTSNSRGLRGWRLEDMEPAAPYATLETEWKRVLLAYPGAYVAHRAAFAQAFFGIQERNQLDRFARATQPRDDGMGPNPNTWPYHAWGGLRDVVAGPQARGIWWALLFFALTIDVLRRRDGFGIAVALSAWIYALGNLALAPSSPFRYHMPSVIACLVLLPTAVDAWTLNRRPSATPAQTTPPRPAP